MTHYNVVVLPIGKVLVTESRPREGFTVPEAVLVGVFDTEDDARAAIAKAQEG